MLFPNDKLIIFAKAPIPGKVNTRLIPVVGENGATKLHQNMLEQKLRLTQENTIAPTDLYCWPDRNHPYFQKYLARYPLQLHNQQGDNLGERMAHAMHQANKQHSNTILIGTDSPPLDRDYLIQAFQALQDGADAVIGPAEDGGYILIGLSRFHSEIFQGIRWGEKTVCRQTISKLNNINFDYVELDTLWDVDRPEDLERMADFYN